MTKIDYAIVGGGIVGLAVARELVRRFGGASVAVLEKESGLARHQTGHNSGVIHSGIYYRPGSLKARFATRGCREIVDYCREQGIAHEVCGKVIVATAESELPRLRALRERGRENGLTVHELDADGVRAIEPHCNAVAGLAVPSTGIVDFRVVAESFARSVEHTGGQFYFDTRVTSVEERSGSVLLETSRGPFEAGYLINCAGLFSDRLARLAGLEPGAKIVPFRGEYYELLPERRHLVRHLIYPVPDPTFPFLGVHLTRMMDGSVHCGPNAVLSLKREGYRKGAFDLGDFSEIVAYAGFWRLAVRHARAGLGELWRSVSKAAFVRSLQRLVPDIGPGDVVATGAGVRAQALGPNGELIDDFLIVRGRRSIHVCNAPSPAATASLPIGRAVVDMVQQTSLSAA